MDVDFSECLPDEEGKAPMYIAQLGHALRRSGQLHLCVKVCVCVRERERERGRGRERACVCVFTYGYIHKQVMDALRMPPSPGAPGSERVEGVLSPGNKIIINDNIRIDRAALAAVVPLVQVCDRWRGGCGERGGKRERKGEGVCVLQGARPRLHYRLLTPCPAAY